MAAEKHRGQSRIVGILGGMGPAATVDFLNKLVNHTPAERDQEHLRMIIWSDPTVPSRQDALLRDGEDPTPRLKDGLDRLVSFGADLLVVPCNTAHLFLPGVVPGGSEFIDMVEVTMAAVIRRASSRQVGVLATDAALACGLFQSPLADAGYEAVLPIAAEQQKLMWIVDRVKTRGADASTAAHLDDILRALSARGAMTCIAGCTELSVVLAETSPSGDVDVIDPALELALMTIERAWASG